MPVKRLPSKPNLDHLKYQARDLRKELETHNPAAAQRIREFHPRFARASDAEIFAAPFTLSDAQLTIARESGFPSWTRLKKHIEKPTLADRLELPHHERIEDTELRRAVDLLDAGDVAGLRAYLKQYPDVVHRRALFEGGNYFQNPTLLEFAAENPVRRGKLPANIVDVAKIIVEAGAGQTALNVTLALAATGSVPYECRAQIPLIDLLCAHGADPNSALQAAALHGNLESVNALLAHGAVADLVVGATLGRVEDVRRLLPHASPRDKQLALSQAAQHGHLEIALLLLDAGADPNRYNPVGHSHTTPLHQAAAYGPEEIVRLFVERGAKLDVKDILWQGTPADWAAHVGRRKIEAYLRSQAKERESRK
jgi:Ankyrin repeats (3 copies)/Ankyrin repeat